MDYVGAILKNTKLLADMATALVEIAENQTYLTELHREAKHLSAIFPVSTANTCTLTAGDTNNTFGDWAEIVDDQGTPHTLSSKAATVGLHISSTVIEDVNTRDKEYLIEIGYGGSNTVISRHRFRSGTNVNPTTQQARIRNVNIPAGETIKYRMMCQTADATCAVHIRHHEE